MLTKKTSPETVLDPKPVKASKTTPNSTTNPAEPKPKMTGGCCMGTTSCSTTSSSPTLKTPSSLKMSSSSCGDSKKGPKTRVMVKYDVGFDNSLYVRGRGANLSWEKGIPLKNLKNDEWVWETEHPFTTCEFKVLVNDKHYEAGENHPLTCGANIQYTPQF